MSRDLSRAVAELRFSLPVTHIYNPLEYAWTPHSQYLERYGSVTPREVMLVGMNPGPWGMAQTGVPFGEVRLVADWLGIEAEVDRPAREHAKRPVHGFACRRREVSGQRLWGWAKRRFATPERFFQRFFIANYCPLMFLEEGGRNRTPDRLPAVERAPLLTACDQALRRTVELLSPQVVVGIGRFAESRALRSLAGMQIRVGRILHPSPASPAANRDWSGQAERQLRALGVPV